MTKYREILRLNQQQLSSRSIAAFLGCSRNTVSKVLESAAKHGLTWPLPLDISDEDLEHLLFPERSLDSDRMPPDFEYVHKELARNGVSMTLLWDEYCIQCRDISKIPYMYTQFCKLYRDFAMKNKATSHIHRKPGDTCEVDWAGDTTSLIDNVTGECIDVYVFVAALTCSSYAYVEAFLNMDTESWITGHINAFRHFGGVTRILVPDNLKTGISKPHPVDPTINKVYQEMAEYYGTVVIPARVKMPRDKPMVESTVDTISTWIIAALRKQQFFSIGDLNREIRKKLLEFNSKPFQKKPGSRLSAFLEEEKMHLIPLPALPYELATWKIATVQFNYHVSVEKNYCSVPYEYIKHKVDVRMTKRVIEIYYHHTRIASHVRLLGKTGHYSTNIDHMPDKHRDYALWDGDRFIRWAAANGIHTEIVVRSILHSHKIEQQAYKSCFGLLKLADKYSVTRLEAACRRALSYTPNPSYRSIQTILKNGSDKLVETAAVEPKKQAQGFVRGAEYYGGVKKND
jgi:transposase